tara:strand:- start:46502 stop:47251 length:750 start_codon:yes stop_codon:yes gene_type:complete
MRFNSIKLNIIKDNILKITFNRRKKLNALNTELSNELVQALKEADKNNNIKCIIISGYDNFSAGAEINEFKVDPRFIEIWDDIDKIKKPIIASVSGLAIGGGCELLLMSDIIIASSNSKFGQPEINLGLIPGGGATQRLPRIIGLNNSMELCLTGKLINAQEAKDLGLINKICTAEELDSVVSGIAIEIASKPLKSITYIKKLIKESSNIALKEGLKIEKKYFYELVKSPNGVEGINAFIEKRKPDFKN